MVVPFLDHSLHLQDIDFHLQQHPHVVDALKFSVSGGHDVHPTGFLSQAINTDSMPADKIISENALQTVQQARTMMQDLESKIETLQVAAANFASKMTHCQPPVPGVETGKVCEPKLARRALDQVAWQRARVESAQAQVLAAVKAALQAVQQGGAMLSSPQGATSQGSPKNPALWGPQAWKFLHCLAQSLPEQVPPAGQQSFEAMIQSLPQLLPCPSCGSNLQRHLLEDPIKPNLGTRTDVQRWLVRLHNKVNAELGKPVMPEAQALAAVASACGQPEIAAPAVAAPATMASFPAPTQAASAGLLFWVTLVPSQPQHKCSAEISRWEAFFPSIQ